MARKRILGVAGATLGLSLLTVMLLALGYVALNRFGGTGEAPPVEIRGNQTTTPLSGAGGRAPNPDDLRVIRAQDATQVPHTSAKPSIAPPSLDLRGDADGADGELLWPVPPIGTDGFGAGPTSGPLR